MRGRPAKYDRAFIERIAVAVSAFGSAKAAADAGLSANVVGYCVQRARQLGIVVERPARPRVTREERLRRERERRAALRSAQPPSPNARLRWSEAELDLLADRLVEGGSGVARLVAAAVGRTEGAVKAQIERRRHRLLAARKAVASAAPESAVRRSSIDTSGLLRLLAQARRADLRRGAAA